MSWLVRILGRAWYRTRQFSNVFRARLTPDEHALVRRVLSSELQRLFYDMRPIAQRHHVDVCRDLQRQGWDDPELLAAALLHDVGKGHLHVWARVAIVLAEHFAPGLLKSSAARPWPSWDPRSWLAADACHAEAGAALVAAAGGSPRTAALIRLHESRRAGDPALDALRRADDTH